jgi:hypothetical protein
MPRRGAKSCTRKQLQGAGLPFRAGWQTTARPAAVRPPAPPPSAGARGSCWAARRTPPARSRTRRLCLRPRRERCRRSCCRHEAEVDFAMPYESTGVTQQALRADARSTRPRLRIRLVSLARAGLGHELSGRPMHALGKLARSRGQAVETFHNMPAKLPALPTAQLCRNTHTRPPTQTDHSPAHQSVTGCSRPVSHHGRCTRLIVTSGVKTN